MQNQNALTSGIANVTMTSLELVDFINSERKEQALAADAEFPSKGYAELQHKDFLEKVLTVLGNRSAEFSANLPDIYGRARKGYQFPKREACLMAMSYSYDLQAKVFDRMTALEHPASQLPQKSPESRAVIALEALLRAAMLLSVPTHMAQVEAVKYVRLAHTVDFTPLLLLAPAQSSVTRQDEMLEPTEIGKHFGVSAIKANRMLEAAGLQVKGATRWEATPDAEGMWTLHQWVDGNKSGFNLKWRLSAIKEVFETEAA